MNHMGPVMCSNAAGKEKDLTRGSCSETVFQLFQSCKKGSSKVNFCQQQRKKKSSNRQVRKNILTHFVAQMQILHHVSHYCYKHFK